MVPFIQYFRKGKSSVRKHISDSTEEQNDCKETGGNAGGDGNIPTMTAEVITQFKCFSKFIKL